MPTTYEAIATVTVGSGGAADVTINNIPQTYTDLLLFFSIRGTNYTGAFQNLRIRMNGSGNNTNYSQREIRGNGSAVASATGGTTQWEQDRYPTQNTTASTFGNGRLYIPNYTSSNNKSAISDSVMENMATESWLQLSAYLWSNTDAITSIYLAPANGGGTDSFAQYSTFTLYGIKNS